MPHITRRRFLVYGAGVVVPASVGAGLFVPLRRSAPGLAATATFRKPTLPGSDIPKFRDPLPILPAMPRLGLGADAALDAGGAADRYVVAARQFAQQVLPRGLPATTVLGYGALGSPGSFHWPSPTIEARVGTPVRVRWINDLRSQRTGRFLPHPLPIDQTLHWANPPGGAAGRDTTPTFTATPGAYRGPVPTVVHLHGSERSPDDSDGYPEAWFLPDAANVPSGFARVGSLYDTFRRSSPLGGAWSRGNAVFRYPNQQRATTLWFHDHALGLTRVNVYAGLEGFYVLRGGPSDQVSGTLPGPAPMPGDRPGTAYHELALMIQDRSFNADGSLFYPDSREFFDGFAGPFIPDSDMPPIWNSEFFGDSMAVNGRTWPFLQVEQRRYRFRLLNACNSRFLMLENDRNLPFWVIGTDGGFLPRPVQLSRLLVAPAERFDVIVDFTNVPRGSTVTLVNVGPDEPFGGGEPGVDFTPADPKTTGQVLQFRVVARSGADHSTPPDRLGLPPLDPLGGETSTRQVSVSEFDSAVLPGVGPLRSQLGGLKADGTADPRRWHEDPTERPAAGSTEVWEIHNFTEDAHPIHIHVTQFQVVSRQPMAGGPARPPERWESGFKDMVIAYPGEIARVRARFHEAGLFVWHCHILEHEDNEMMRPMRVV
jgi:bilirubin oxidase